MKALSANREPLPPMLMRLTPISASCAAVFEVAVGREVGRRGDDPRVLDDLVGADRAATPHVGETEAGGRQRLEAERGQEPRGTRIPRIGDDEGAGPPVQFLKGFGFFRLRAHARTPVPR